MKKRDTQIICTLGPASESEEVLVKMASHGMNVSRLNFSHGDHDGHLQMMKLIAKINKKHHFRIKVMQDLEGFRIRVGHFPNERVLVKDQIVYMSNQEDPSYDHIPFDFSGDIKLIKKGTEVFIDDGNIFLKVMDNKKNRLKLKVIQGGILKQRKGLNIPKLKLQDEAMTPKDKDDLAFGIENKVDYVAQSFVRNSKDIKSVMERVKAKLPQCKVIAKIENHEGVSHIDSIINACDGIMVARGDLGVSLPIYKVPLIQKYIIRRCVRKKKLVIVATQMLESMTTHNRPTRAEVADVANAVLDGTDFVMLSGETAVGKYPSRSVQMMSQIIEYTEHRESARF
jgi:pyruvate kinase